MRQLLGKTRNEALVKLSGKIHRYQCSRRSASFVLIERDERKLGIVAVAAAAVGLGGQAASLATSASDVEEAADYVQFEIDKKLVRGWVWRSPFRDGDVVDVAAEWQGDHYEAYAIARPSDKTIALYPHCSRSRWRHIKNTVKWWLVWNVVFFGGVFASSYSYLDSVMRDPITYWGVGFVAACFVLMFISLSRQYMPFVRMAESVFRVLDLPNASDLDLVKSSKAQRTSTDQAEFGTFYFRY
jgi:hypothetical protein